MSTYEAVRYSFNGASISGIVAVEVGTILSWSNSTLPSGYLNCDGTAVSRSTYSALFAVIGTDYGAGNGSSTFNLPNLQDKVPLGVSSSRAVASTGGAETVASSGSLTIASVTPAGNIAGSTGGHTLSTSQIPSHDHDGHVVETDWGYNRTRLYYSQLQNNAQNTLPNTSTGGGGSHSHNLSANFSGSAVTPTGNFSGSATSVVQPYIALKFMIKT